MNTQLLRSQFKYRQEDPKYLGQPLERSLVEGPMETRRCRDFGCYLLYIAFWISLIIVAIVAYNRGSPHLLAAPFDSSGFQCGYSTGYQQFPYAYYNSKNWKQFVCINQCPGQAGLTTQIECRFQNATSNCKSFGNYSTILVVSLCVPTDQTMATLILTGLGFYQKGMSDLKETWPAILAVLFISLVVSLLVMGTIRICGGCIVYTIIGLYLSFLVAFGIMCFKFAGDKDSFGAYSDLHDPKLLERTAYACWTMAGVSFLILLCSARKIQVASVVLRTTATFVQSQWYVIIAPLIMFCTIGAFFSFWVTTSIYIFSCGTVGQCAGSPYACIDWDVGVKRSLGLYFFGLFWNCEFAIAMCHFVVASTTSYWYFGHLRPGRSSSSYLGRSIFRALFYHMGSLAFGALVLSAMRMLQIALQVLHRLGKNKAIQPNQTTNRLTQSALQCLRCTIACFERFVRFISRNAFILMAINGQGFCTSAHQAFYLTVRSTIEYSVCHGVGNVVSLVGRLLIALVSTMSGYLLITHVDSFSGDIYSPFMPTLVRGGRSQRYRSLLIQAITVSLNYLNSQLSFKQLPQQIFFVVSFVVGSLFMSVFGVGSDTLLMCYCLEKDILKGISRACPETLKRVLELNKH